MPRRGARHVPHISHDSALLQFLPSYCTNLTDATRARRTKGANPFPWGKITSAHSTRTVPACSLRFPQFKTEQQFPPVSLLASAFPLPGLGIGPALPSRFSDPRGQQGGVDDNDRPFLLSLVERGESGWVRGSEYGRNILLGIFDFIVCFLKTDKICFATKKTLGKGNTSACICTKQTFSCCFWAALHLNIFYLHIDDYNKQVACAAQVFLVCSSLPTYLNEPHESCFAYTHSSVHHHFFTSLRNQF